MTSLEVRWARLDDRAELPGQAYPGDAGFDLVNIADDVIRPGETLDLRTGIAVAIPEGWWGRIVGRSSTMRKRGLLVVEGVIDAGFRGELFTCVHNPGNERVPVKAGTSLAQLLFLPVPSVHWAEVTELPPSERGTNGFGSSGR